MSNSNEEMKNTVIKIEKWVVLSSSIIFLIASIFANRRLDGFFFDYIILSYSIMLIIFICINTVNKDFLKEPLSKYFGVITGPNGKGIVIICISLVFIKVSGWCYKLAVILFMIAGISLIILEILVPTTISNEHSQLRESHQLQSNSFSNTNNEAVNVSQLDKSEEKKDKDNPYNVPDDF